MTDGPGTLAVLRRRNRLRILMTVVAAVVLYWLATLIAAVTVGLAIALRILLEGDWSSFADLQLLGIGLGAVAALSAVVGTVVAAVRLPLQRRRLEARVLAETRARVVDAPSPRSEPADPAGAADPSGPADLRRVANLLEGLAIAAGVPPPRFAVVDDPAPNSFAVGTRPKKVIVAVTQGAIDTLARDELEAILAYEVSRIDSRDVALASWTVALTGAAIGALDDGAKRLLGWLPYQGAVRLQRWALRDTAFDRDRAAVRFTRNPASLADALEALRRDRLVVARVSAATAPLWVEVPGAPEALDARIAELRRLAGLPDTGSGGRRRAGRLIDPPHHARGGT